MHIPTFKMPTIRQVWQLIQQGDYALSTDLKDAYLHITKHLSVLHVVLQHKPYQWKVLSFRLAITPRIFTTHTKPVPFFADARFFTLLSIWMISWS